MSLVRHYQLSSSDDYIGQDSSGFGSDMTNLNATLVTDPTYGDVAYFDGTASLTLPQSLVPDAMTGGNTRTLSLWFRMDTGSTSLRRWLFSILNFRSLMEFNQTYTFFFSAGDTYNPGFVYSEDTWYNIAVVYDSITDVATSYTDGQVDGTHSVVMNTGPSDFMIADNVLNIPGGNNFKGMITDVRIYDYALSLEEIGTLFSQGPGLRVLSASIFTHLADITWESISGASTYRLTQKEGVGDEEEVVSPTTETSATLGNLEPGSSYDLSLYTDMDEDIPVDVLSVSTPVVDASSVQDILTRFSNDLSDLEGVSSGATEDISVFFEDVLSTGDVILTDIGETMYVRESESLVLSRNGNILTPFVDSGGSGQEITVNSDVISYDESTNEVISGGTSHAVGDVFVIGNYKVTTKEI